MRNMLVYLKMFIFYKEEKGGGGWGWFTGTEIYVSPIINSLTIWHYPPVSSIQCVDITVFSLFFLSTKNEHHVEISSEITTSAVPVSSCLLLTVKGSDMENMKILISKKLLQ